MRACPKARSNDPITTPQGCWELQKSQQQGAVASHPITRMSAAVLQRLESFATVSFREA